MKKSLTALAVLGVFAGSAMAADVTLYGAIDTGLEYIHNKTTDFAGDSVKEDKFDHAEWLGYAQSLGPEGF